MGAQLFSALGILALIVAIVGIYSTVAYGVSQRGHEFGVRIALGARLADVVRMVVGEELRVVGAGVLGGLSLAFSGGRPVSSLLYDVSHHDPVAMGLVAALLLTAGVLASLAPAWPRG